jgi:hypothetical protein
MIGYSGQDFGQEFTGRKIPNKNSGYFSFTIQNLLSGLQKLILYISTKFSVKTCTMGAKITEFVLIVLR